MVGRRFQDILGTEIFLENYTRHQLWAYFLHLLEDGLEYIIPSKTD